jgi:hypothetical protein
MLCSRAPWAIIRPGLFVMAAFPIPSKTLYGAARFGVGEAR